MSEVNDQIAAFKDTITAVASEVNDICKHLSVIELNAVPYTGGWSIAQHLDHLIKVNESYYPIIEEVKSVEYKAPWQAKVGFLTSTFGKMILKSVLPQTTRKTKTMTIWQPTELEFDFTILSRFESAQFELIKFIEESKDLLEKNIVIPSPANRTIQYKIRVAVDIILAHEQRHLQHIRQIVNEFPQT